MDQCRCLDTATLAPLTRLRVAGFGGPELENPQLTGQRWSWLVGRLAAIASTGCTSHDICHPYTKKGSWSLWYQPLVIWVMIPADIPKITEPGWKTRTRRGALLRPYLDQWQCGSARDKRDLKRGWKTAGNDWQMEVYSWEINGNHL